MQKLYCNSASLVTWFPVSRVSNIEESDVQLLKMSGDTTMKEFLFWTTAISNKDKCVVYVNDSGVMQNILKEKAKLIASHIVSSVEEAREVVTKLMPEYYTYDINACLTGLLSRCEIVGSVSIESMLEEVLRVAKKYSIVITLDALFGCIKNGTITYGEFEKVVMYYTDVYRRVERACAVFVKHGSEARTLLAFCNMKDIAVDSTVEQVVKAMLLLPYTDKEDLSTRLDFIIENCF